MAKENDRHLKNFRELALLSYPTAIRILWLRVLMRDRNVSRTELIAASAHGRTWVQAILNAEPAPYGKQKRKANNAFVAWLDKGVDELEQVFEQIISERALEQ